MELVTHSFGSDDCELLATKLNHILAGRQHLVIVSAGAKDAELLDAQYAQEYGLGLKQVLPDRKLDGRGAKVILIAQMLDAADHAVFFWDAKNNGTANAIEKGRQRVFRWRWCGSVSRSTRSSIAPCEAENINSSRYTLPRAKGASSSTQYNQCAEVEVRQS